MLLDTLIPFLHGNRWTLAWYHIALMLALPATFLAVADRLLRRSR